MGNERKLRLIQVAKEFKVGLNTITDFLQKKGIKSDGSPNTLVDAETYAVLEKEFGANRAAGNARESIRERISLKQTTITLEEAKKQEREEEKEVVIKSNVISVKDEIQQPKFLGKIDLSPKPKAAPAPKAEAEKPAAQHPAAPAAPAPAQAPKAAAQPAPAPAPAVPEARPAQPAPATQASHAAPATPAPAAQAAPAEPAKPAAPATPAPTAQAPGQPDAKPAEAPAPAPEPAAPKDNIFRPETVTLTGPQVLGTMDVSGFVAGGKHKRKRLQKEKVDVSKAPRGNAQGGGNKQGGQGGQGGQNRPGQGGQNRPGAQNQPKPGEGRRNKNKGKAAPKPIVRPEVSDEEVSKQVKDTLARLTAKGAKSKSAKYRKDKRDAVAERMNEEFEREEQERSTLKVTEFVTVSELATMMNVSPTQVITACMNLGLMVSINQRLDAEALVVVAEEFGYKVEFVSVEIQEAINDEGEDKEEDLVPRPPIVTVMGHVDHGKTSLLDNIRKTNVIEGEAGGITQHIGAYSVELNGQKITFLDTPGHEAFTAMRARGAAVTDVAIIIVAADDSVMPQTIEAINHAQAAGVPMVFAINKIDKPNANPDHIKEQLSQMNYLVESWGGKYQDQEVSAKKGLNLDKLLEKVLLEAEMLDLKANPDKKAQGTVIESTLDKGRGYVSTILVQSGTLHVGDVILSGTYTGRVKAMFNENGKKVESAGPSTPVQVLGLNGAPQAGDTFNVMEDDRSAREIANKREQLQRMQGIMTQKHVTLDEIGRRIAIGSFKELNIIVKGDVDGSIEAMSGSLIKLSKETVQVNVIHAAVGQISESDVLLAAASNAIIVGFQVRPSAAARKLAEKEEIEIRLYSIIYDAINDIKDAIEGMLEPVMKEEIVASVEVLEIFKISKVGTVAGCIVREGKLQRNTPIRVIRDGIVIYTGKLGSLKRFKDDVKEVTAGQDCGLNIESFNDIRVGDIVEGYEQVEVKRK
ncbi:translation initiation factor IF-2 [Alistipes onderdonkii]|jgi:translation initiation factor IF-2|uniref:Translation initiation factor IF-2 n=1 Tax=Alistipes onderdonkii TaxID=328813 RepID=A0A9P3ZGT5_9BACT|nr:translation initiation factor IF-2 [Alistipes onderdonkii]CUO67181.1 Translation initiation factor IF-2 [Alistipes finegoldii]KAA2407202.1 translation initiation factor IF-2 [Alistipes onderdonkii]KAA2409108.1 translation initiation factor IF-2 [Alistipes onderdonkii]KAA2415915.1 translation initiation factor IF-2 [Alistipes onderdonkii]KAA2418797.1 translation initiation factor IF-2 [Alistipes onderdonkii]